MGTILYITRNKLPVIIYRQFIFYFTILPVSNSPDMVAVNSLLSSSDAAESIIPWEISSLNLIGFKFATTITNLPTRSSGL